MRLHGAWPPCVAVASGWAVVGFKLARVLFPQTKHAHRVVCIRTTKPLKPSPTAAHHHANSIDKKVSNIVLEFSAIVNTRRMAIPY